MSLFARREARALGDVGNPLIPSRGASGTTAGMPVTTDTALTHSAVWACTRLRADLVSTMPLRAFRRQGGRRVELDVLPPLLQDPGGTRVGLDEWLYMTQISLDLRGNAYGKIVARDGYQLPQQIELAHPDAVNVRTDRATGRTVYRIDGKPVDAEDVYHERAYPMAGTLTGLSPIGYHARTIGTGLAAGAFGADWFADGAHPSSVLSTEQRVDDVQAKTIKARFMEAVRGTREPVVLGAGVTYQAIQVSPDESQFLETMRYGVQDVCRIYGIPPEMIGADSGASMTYANVEQRSIDALTYSFGPTLFRREKRLSRLLPTAVEVEFQTKALLRTDLETRYKAHAISIAARWRTPDEVREEEGEQPLTAAQKALLELVPLTVTPTGAPKTKTLPAAAPPAVAPPTEEPTP